MSSSMETVMMDAIIRIETKLAAMEANQKTIMNLLISLKGGGSSESDNGAGEPISLKGLGDPSFKAALLEEPGPELTEEALKDRSVLRDMTPKQHVVLQLVIRGWRNDKISELMGTSVNTTKQHVRSLMDKFGVRSRSSIAVRATKCIQHMKDHEYAATSGGLPKHWARDIERYSTRKELEQHDPYFKIYTKSGTNGRE